jgi:hypothetical protein
MMGQEAQCFVYVIPADGSFLLITVPGKGYQFLRNRAFMFQKKLQEMIQLISVCTGELKGRMLA